MSQQAKRAAYRLGAAFLILAAGLLFSQTAGKGKMRGLVTDEQGVPIPEVKVKLFCHNAQSSMELISDKEGNWKAFWVRGGSWDLDFLKLGYEPKRISVSIDESGKIWDIPMKLKKVEGLLLTPDLMAQLDQGNALYNQGKYDEALAAFGDLIAKNPEAYIVYLNIGNCHFAKKEYDEAITAYEKVLEKDPGHVKVKLSIGNSYSNKGDQAKALEWYQKIELDKIDDPVVPYNVGVVFFNSGDMPNAEKYLKRAVELKPDFLDGLFQLGIVYIAANNYPEAKTIFDKYLALDPTSERAEQIKQIIKSLK